MTRKNNKIAIFDIDGTIFRKNLHFELIDELVWMKVFPKEVRSQLVNLYSSWLEHRGTYESYRQGIVNVYSKYIKGHVKEDVQRASAGLMPFYKNKTYVFAEDLIAKLKKEGYHIIAISGSPIEVVEEYNRQHLKFEKVFGSVYDTDKNGRYTGESEFEPCHHKGATLKQYVFENKLTLNGSYGIGDTESDASFLELVENPIAFNPNQNLKDIAVKKGWKIVVEKKDVIYQIDCKGGKCEL